MNTRTNEWNFEVGSDRYIFHDRTEDDARTYELGIELNWPLPNGGPEGTIWRITPWGEII